MAKEIYEIPVVLTIHGRIKVRAESEEQARKVADNLSVKRAKQALKEEFTFKRLSIRHEVNNDSSGILEEANGENDDNKIRSDH